MNAPEQKPCEAVRRVLPGSFEQERHMYPKVLNAQIHPSVASFFNLDQERILSRYCHLHPQVDAQKLREMLLTSPRTFLWGGCDLFHVTTSTGIRQMVVVETNSCPSGQKSMPIVHEEEDQGGYRFLMRETFRNLLLRRRLCAGELAVLYDKNSMEATGYAAAMADEFAEPVYLVECYADNPDPAIRFEDGVLYVRNPEDEWVPIRAAFRYVTQRPWTRIPPLTKTVILNPVLACLAGGRNKAVAAKAYEMFNGELEPFGLQICVPETIRNVEKDQVPHWVEQLGGHAVVKIPYANAGQGVFTITHPEELAAFMAQDYRYRQFIVQSLIGNSQWSSHGRSGRFFHVGTVPDKRGRIFVADIRMMVAWTPQGAKPIAMYGRRSRAPLPTQLDSSQDSWEILGTNLSIRLDNNQWSSDTDRLLLVDYKDFNRLGLGLDDLIDAFIQTVLAMWAIDRMSQQMLTQKGQFRKKLFAGLNEDEVLLEEIMEG